MQLLVGYVAALAIFSTGLEPLLTTAHSAEIERGRYLVRLGGCSDCHTPGYFVGNPDLTRFLAGSDVGFKTPVGTFVGPNLTPDRETGLGGWTKDEIVSAIKTGFRPDGRVLADAMPWKGYSELSKSDAGAIVVYLKSLKPVSHKVAGPFGATDKPTVKVFTLMSPDAQN